MIKKLLNKIADKNISAVIGVLICIAAFVYSALGSVSMPVTSALTVGTILGFGLNMMIFNKSISKEIIEGDN